MRTKKTFVLLEVLIGFALVSISILPFLRYPYRHMQKELDMLFQMQLTRHAQERLCEIEREMCENLIDLKHLWEKEKKDDILALDRHPIKITLPNKWSRTYEEKLIFKKTAQRENGEGLYNLIHIHLRFYRNKKKVCEFHTELIALKKI